MYQGMTHPIRFPAVLVRSCLLAGVACLLLVFLGVSCGGGGDGTIEVAGSGVTIQLSGPKTLTVRSGDKVTVPAGTYKATQVQVAANENAGGQSIVWTIKNKGSLGELEKIKVRSGNTTTIQAGPPFTVRAKTVITGSGPQQVVGVDMQIVGASGELYDHEVRRGSSVVASPKCRVVDGRGGVVAQGTLSYG